MAAIGQEGRAARHRTSHVGLLTPAPPGRLPGSVNAVIVPTHRPVVLLEAGIELARELRCPILVLCSGESKADSASSLLTGVAGMAVTIASTPRSALLDLRTQRLAPPLAGPYLDTGNKRNIALLLGRMLNWSRLLFLDDDIGDLTAAEVMSVAGVVEPQGLQVVGWRFQDFPDNSVVCHALRSSGHPQDVFIGSGALLVGLFGRLPFFPPVYNEDWLFWHDFVAVGRVGLAGVEVRQLPYEPFDQARARREEFGDVLAEGLFNLIHEQRTVSPAHFPAYWDSVLAERRRLLDGILHRLDHLACHSRDARQHEKELLAVEAARAELDLITAQSLAEFVGAWRHDLYRWNARLHGLPRFTRIADALAWLGITDVHAGR
jgi:hypothetical protein